MASHFTSTAETPEEREIRKRKQTVKRIRIMMTIFGMAIVARVFIKNPPPPRTPDYSKYKVRYVPGMLDAIPAAERSKMDPKILARIQQADDDARYKRTNLPPMTALAKGPYKASETPLASQTQQEVERQFAYSYEKRRHEKIHQLEEQELRSTTKTTVVEFAGGGYVHVEKAARDKRVCEIKFDRSISASVPSTMVKNVRTDAADWSPPLSKGEVSLKPARGITIILQRQLATRITIPNMPLQ